MDRTSPREIVLTIAITAVLMNFLIHRDRWEIWREQPAPATTEPTAPEEQAPTGAASTTRESVAVAAMPRVRRIGSTSRAKRWRTRSWSTRMTFPATRGGRDAHGRVVGLLRAYR